MLCFSWGAVALGDVCLSSLYVVQGYAAIGNRWECRVRNLGSWCRLEERRNCLGVAWTCVRPMLIFPSGGRLGGLHMCAVLDNILPLRNLRRATLEAVLTASASSVCGAEVASDRRRGKRN